MNPTRIGLIRAARQKLSGGVTCLDMVEIEEIQGNTGGTEATVASLRRRLHDAELLLNELLAEEP